MDRKNFLIKTPEELIGSLRENSLHEGEIKELKKLCFELETLGRIKFQAIHGYRTGPGFPMVIFA